MKKLKKWITTIAQLIQQDKEIDPECYAYFVDNPDLAIGVVDVLASLDERRVDANPSRYTACIFLLDVCVTKLQAASESSSKLADKMLEQLMAHIAAAIDRHKHSLSFWLPILHAFYDVQISLSEPLKAAYLELANEESDQTSDDDITHLTSIRDLIEELGDLSVFDIAENFFAQSYAMPPDFFVDLVLDLYHLEEGHDIALLTLLHPNQEVREVVVATIDSLINTITLSSISLSRLQMIKQWYPKTYHAQFDEWITIQRKKEVVFYRNIPGTIVQLKASEIDGSGAQGIFVHVRNKQHNRLCGLLLKSPVGIKDAWITPPISAEEVHRYYQEAFDDGLALRRVDLDYVIKLSKHFLALSLANGHMPDLHLLEIQEVLGVQLSPERLDVATMVQNIGIHISPFTTQGIHESLLRSKRWLKTKAFAASWFVENAIVDKLVNQCAGFVDGVKVCDIDQAMRLVCDEFEQHRAEWLFHFLWVTLWLSAGSQSAKTLWQDSFFIAHIIQAGTPLMSIPLMQAICRRSVLHSIATMQERRTYLS